MLEQEDMFVFHTGSVQSDALLKTDKSLWSSMSACVPGAYLAADGLLVCRPEAFLFRCSTAVKNMMSFLGLDSWNSEHASWHLDGRPFACLPLPAGASSTAAH